MNAVPLTVSELVDREQDEKDQDRQRQAILDNIPDIAWLKDADGCLIAGNQALFMNFRVQAKDIIGKTVFEYLPAELAEKYTATDRQVIENGQRMIFEVPLINRKGEERWIESIITPIFDQKGKVHRTAGIARDITERKRTEQVLKEIQEFNASLLESAPNPIMVCSPDASIKYINPAMEKLTGYSAKELVGIKPPFPYWGNHDLENKTAKVKAYLTLGNYVNEEVFYNRNGSPFWVEISGTAVKLRDEIKYITISWIDITERKQSEEKLRHAAEEWRRTFDSISESVCIMDNNYRVIRVNKAFARACGVRPNQAIGRNSRELVGCRPEWHENCPYQRTLKTGQPATAEHYDAKSGDCFEVSTSPIFNDKGEVVGVVRVSRDMTEHRRMQEQLLLTDRLASIGELASGLAHELNNPLTSVIGYTQLLVEKELPGDIKEDLELVYSEAMRTSVIVKNLLTFGRKHAPVKQSVRIERIIEEVLKLREYEQKVNNIRVHKIFDPDLPEVMVDYFQMQQVFFNLIINAEFFMTEFNHGGNLTVSTQKINNGIRITFRDDGPGISKENMHRLFNPFFTTKEVGKGTGLGLSICHGIISEHGGRIYARSLSGQGAAFIVELPPVESYKPGQ